MKISFTLNVTSVLNEAGEEIPTTEGHYRQAVKQFKEDNKDSEHELVMMDSEPSDTRADAIYFEMEDIEGHE